ncbi:MAG: hypothetical protein PHX43_00855 [Alphaproteobacteria bacterium]|nr:hypothetical protein [Alphaproteobacteria bacterium]
MKKKDTSIREKLCAAAVKLASQKAWEEITISQIAKTAKVPLKQAAELYSETEEILPSLMEATDKRVKKTVGIRDKNESAHDRLFEIFMARFDDLQKNRKSAISISNACRKDPRLARIMLKSQWNSMREILLMAGIDDDGSKKILQVCSLVVVYNLTIYRWLNDETEDMAKTMAALDRGLKFNFLLTNQNCFR